MEKIKEILTLIFIVFVMFILFLLFILFTGFITDDVDAQSRLINYVFFYGIPILGGGSWLIVLILKYKEMSLTDKERYKKKLTFYYSRYKKKLTFGHSMNNVQKSFLIIGVISFVYFMIASLSFSLMIGSGLSYYLFKDN
jgi:hypothetical protein